MLIWPTCSGTVTQKVSRNVQKSNVMWAKEVKVSVSKRISSVIICIPKENTILRLLKATKASPLLDIDFVAQTKEN